MTMETPWKQKGSSATFGVYQHLRDEVLASRLRPDEQLNIAELSTRLKVSPGAVREALSRLTAESLVIAEPHRGFRVSPISAVELRDITAVRVEVEAMCLRRAIALGNEEWETSIRDAFAVLSQLPEREEAASGRMNPDWARAHAAFHLALVDACASPWLLHMRDMLFRQTERYRQLSSPPADVQRDGLAEHRQIMRATVDRNIDLAAALMRTHLLMTVQVIVGKGLASEAVPAKAPSLPARRRVAGQSVS